MRVSLIAIGLMLRLAGFAAEVTPVNPELRDAYRVTQINFITARFTLLTRQFEGSNRQQLEAAFAVQEPAERAMREALATLKEKGCDKTSHLDEQTLQCVTNPATSPAR